MITERMIGPEDYDVLLNSLANDEFHQGTIPEFFVEERTVCKVFELDEKPVLFLRGKKSIRLDLQFVDNNNFKANLKVMIDKFPAFVEQCKANGFGELVFNTSHPVLEKFCIKRLGFEKVNGSDLVRSI